MIRLWRWFRMMIEWPDLLDEAISKEQYEQLKRDRREMYGLDPDARRRWP